MRKIIALVSCLCLAIGVQAATVEQSDGYVVIRPDGGGARVVRLLVVGDAIIRVQATSENQLPQKPQSLMVVEQTARPKYTVNGEDGEVRVSTSRVQAVVSKQTGQVRFLDAEGNSIATEARDGKSFAPFRVPDREIGVDIGRVTENQRNALSWRMVFDLQEDEALYGLGQHQSEELNMRGKNEDLFQYNTKVSVPFVISSRGYGILWDSYSYCRFGQPEDYLQLNRAFRLYDKHGREGHLTGTYTDMDGRSLVRDEDSIYYEYDVPQTSALCRKYDLGGIQNLPKGFKLKGSTVVYEGFIEPLTAEANSSLFTLHSERRCQLV